MAYLLVDDVERLRAKLAGGRAPLDRWWPHFLQLARQQSRQFPLFPALAYLGTGEQAYAELARERLLEEVRKLPAAEYAIYVQFHTWCNTQPIARAAIAYDWVADSGVFSADEQAEIAERFVDYAYKHSYMTAQSRIPSSNNQIMAMCFGCAVIGHLFGTKRGQDPRARELFAYGVGRFPDFPGLAQPGGYSLEGSTYMDQVVMPTVALWAAFMEDLTGEDYLSRRYPPSDACLREALELDALLISPGGLLPPWDHYGFQRAMNKCGIAYLARKTGQYGWLARLVARDMWAEADTIVWGTDDKLWTLLWWPEDADIPPDNDPFHPWVIPNTAAALDAGARALRLFQYWDRCGTDYEVSRMQVNPNAIALEAFGSPLLVDGYPLEGCREFAYPPDVFPFLTPELLERSLQLFKEIGKDISAENWIRTWSYGCLGGSNSILVDGEGWHSPSEEQEGQAVAFAALPALSAVTSEATAFYRPHYDVTEMRRTSLLVRGSYLLVRDRMAAETSHRWTWQAYARPGAREVGDGFRLATPEQVGCDILPAAAVPRALRHVPDYLHVLERSADLLQFTQEGTEAGFAVCLYPHLLLEPAVALAHWQAGIDAEGEDRPWQRAAQAGPSLSLADMPFFAPEAPAEAWRWLQCTVTRPRGERIFLRVEKAVVSTRVWVNGREIAPPDTTSAHDLGERLTPLVVEITAALRDGDNLLTLAAQPLRGKTLAGVAGLCRAVAPPPPPVLREVVPGCYAVEAEGRHDLLIADNDGFLQVEGWETDAWCALLDPAEGAALGATCCRGAGVEIAGTRADLSWTGHTLSCGALDDGADLWCAWAGGVVHLEVSGVLRLTGQPGTVVDWIAEHARPVLANGMPLLPEIDPITRHCAITLPAAATPAGDDLVARLGRAVALGWDNAEWSVAGGQWPGKDVGGDGSLDELLSLLADDFWQVRCAAALSLGQRREREAVPALVALLEAELAKDNYPPLGTEPTAEALGIPDGDFLAATPQERYVKRWRVIMCAAIALGQIGDPAAVPALCAVLDRNVDFYPALANAALALGRIGDPSALPALERYADYFEVNARLRAREAIKACMR